MIRQQYTPRSLTEVVCNPISQLLIDSVAENEFKDAE